jgi:5-methyltetrahydropteroyltriglutamate--homocysteine methyltransferase
VPAKLMGLLGGKDVLVGAIDVATDRVETPDEVAATIARALEFVPPEHLCPCTNCGMAPMDAAVAEAKMQALVKGTELARRRFA